MLHFDGGVVGQVSDELENLGHVGLVAVFRSPDNRAETLEELVEGPLKDCSFFVTAAHRQ